MKNYVFLLAVVCYTTFGISQSNTIPEERWDLVKQYLAQQTEFSGMIMLGEKGKIKFNQGYGYADRKAQIRFSDKTLGTIGSITKPFTATAIMLLIERGKISPTDPISLYFEKVPKDKAKITIHELLTHSAGFPGAIGDDYEAISAIDFQARAWKESLLFKPGTAYEYSNTGYSLLGMIVEKVGGQSYSSFLQENIFKPAGMTTAGYRNPGADYKYLAHGYQKDGSDWGTSHDKKWNVDEPYWHLKANGGLLMSAQDMYHWYLALRNHIVLTPASMTLQTTPHVDEGHGDSYYGYGYAVDKNGETVEHNGGNMIFSADFRWFPKKDFFLYSTTNDANVRLFRLNENILRILMTGELPVQENWKEIPLNQFPMDLNQSATQALIDLLKNYSLEKSKRFVNTHCSSGMIERNGADRLNEIFEMLHHDSDAAPVEAIRVHGEKIQLVLSAKDNTASLKIEMAYLDHKIDRLSAEIEGK